MNVPAMAEILFALRRKAVGTEKTMASPKVGRIPQKTPMATPLAIFSGESLILTMLKRILFIRDSLGFFGIGTHTSPVTSVFTLGLK